MHEDARKLVVLTLGSLLVASTATATVIGVTKLMGSPTLSINQISTLKSQTFTVSGESKMSVVPDQAMLQIGIVQRELTVSSAQNKVNTVMNELKTQLLSLGIKEEDIKTTNYSVNPEYDYSQPGNQRVVGYSVSSNVEVTTTDFEKVNTIIDTATNVGANQVGGLVFSLSDEKQKELETKAREEAFKEANSKAQELASLSGMKLGRVIDVSEHGMPQYKMMVSDVRNMALEFPSDEAISTEISPGTTDLNYTLTVSYETL